MSLSNEWPECPVSGSNSIHDRQISTALPNQVLYSSQAHLRVVKYLIYASLRKK